MRNILMLIVFLFVFAVTVFARPPRYWQSSTADQTDVDINWGYKSPLVQVDVQGADRLAASDTTDMWIVFDGKTAVNDTIRVPSDGLTIPGCDCSSIRIIRSTEATNVHYDLWVH